MSIIDSDDIRDQRIYELEMAVRILAEQTARLLADKHSKAGQGRPTIGQQFVDQVSIMGIADAIKAKSTCLKIAWVIIFVVSLATSSFLVYRVVDEYLQDPTATKVELERNATYAYPTIVLCLDSWFSMAKARELGFTRKAIKYALNYFIRYEDIQQPEAISQKCNKSWKQGELEFLRAFNESNFSNLIDFYKSIALDTAQGENFNSSAVTFMCHGCSQEHASLQKVVIDRGVCYELPLRPESGKLRGSDGMWRLSINVPQLSEGAAERKPHWRLYVNIDLRQIQPTTMFLSIDKTYSTAITVAEQLFRMAPSKNDPCVHRSDASSAVRCATKCLSEEAERRLGCRVLSLETENFDRSPTAYCNLWSCDESRPELDEKIEAADMELCLDACPHECETSVYEGTIDKHWSAGLDYILRVANNQSEVKFESAKIYFKNGAVLRGGVMTYTEVFTFSLETLIGTIGGTCGIWISVGVLTIIQLVLFLIQIAIDKSAYYGNAVVKKISTRSPPTSNIQTSSSYTLSELQSSRT